MIEYYVKNCPVCKTTSGISEIDVSIRANHSLWQGKCLRCNYSGPLGVTRREAIFLWDNIIRTPEKKACCNGGKCGEVNKVSDESKSESNGTTEAMNKLCPNCRREVFVYVFNDDKVHSVRCSNCDFKGPLANTINLAMVLWNRLERDGIVKEYKFWLVWTPGCGAQNPKYRHDTYESAKNEAERLARLNVGQAFYVTEIVGKAEASHHTYKKIEECVPVSQYKDSSTPF